MHGWTKKNLSLVMKLNLTSKRKGLDYPEGR